MKVLLIGGTGNLGSRIIPALLAHNHQVSVFARNHLKLNTLLPTSVRSRIGIISGDAASKLAVLFALRSADADALVACAGAAPMMPWLKSNVIEIETAIITALEELELERKREIRSWILGGMLLLDVPGCNGKWKLVDYLPLYPDDVHKMPLLAKSRHSKWSCVCPAKMSTLSEVITPQMHIDIQQNRKALHSTVSVPPGWKRSMLASIFGNYGDVLSNCRLSMRNAVVFEDVAEFIAANIGNDELIGHRVGLIQS